MMKSMLNHDIFGLNLMQSIISHMAVLCMTIQIVEYKIDLGRVIKYSTPPNVVECATATEVFSFSFFQNELKGW